MNALIRTAITTWLMAAAAAYGDLSAEAISAATGLEATEQSDGVVRIGWPRDDVSFIVDGVPFKPFGGLGSWAAFAASGDSAMVMGDTVVFQDEVDAAMDAAFASGLEVTALHNHFFYDDPAVFFMHIGGHGDAETLARGVAAVWNAIKAVRAKTPVPATSFGGEAPAVTGIDPEPLEAILGSAAKTADGVAKLSWGREGTMHGTPVGGSMGLSTWASFTGNDETAVMAGDFIMTRSEVQPVLKTLREGNVHVVALHNHMIGEEPAFYFVHFWGKGDTKGLARTIRSALDVQAAVD